jgi:hypothetical protein
MSQPTSGEWYTSLDIVARRSIMVATTTSNTQRTVMLCHTLPQWQTPAEISMPGSQKTITHQLAHYLLSEKKTTTQEWQMNLKVFVGWVPRENIAWKACLNFILMRTDPKNDSVSSLRMFQHHRSKV